MYSHCNKCFRQKKAELQLQFYLSSCRHILCAECVQEKCVVCGQRCKLCLISRNMPSSMAAFFEHPKKTFQQFQAVSKFQFEQEASLSTHTLNTLPPKLRKMQQRCEGMLQLDARLRTEIEAEKQRIEKLNAYLLYYEQRHVPRPTAFHYSSQRSQPPLMPTLSSVDSSISNNLSNSSNNNDTRDSLSIASPNGRKSNNFFL